MTDRAQPTQARDTLLLSHANPEDNEFTLWLALQLANEGYRVWCDLTKLLGGEVFWDDIEEVIKTRAVKVLYVLSRTSNAKDGPLKELHFAQGVAKNENLKDFVIPLHIDDLPHGDTTIEITRINTVRARHPGAQGLPAAGKTGRRWRSQGSEIQPDGSQRVVAHAVQRRAGIA